jgi:hypothetical protein
MPEMPHLIKALVKASVLDACELRSRLKCRVKRQQFFELGGMVADAVGSGDEDLPTLFCEGSSLGDGDDDAQPHRGGGSVVVS